MALTFSLVWSKASYVSSISLKWKHLHGKRNVALRFNHLSDIEFVIVRYKTVVSRALSVLGIVKLSSVRQSCAAECTA